jgi:hypothetical protein
MGFSFNIYNLITDDMEDDEKELEHSSLQEKLDKELKELDKKLEQKEVRVSFIYLYCI